MPEHRGGPDPRFRVQLAEADEEVRRCSECGALCDARVQACECGPDCPLPKVDR